MFSLWLIAAGILAVAAALAGRRMQKSDGSARSHSSLPAVSDDWLANMRGRKDDSW